MPVLTCCRAPARFIRLAAVVCLGFSVAWGPNAAASETGAAAKRSFDVPAGDAPVSLKQFAQQAGLELLYSAREMEGARTNAVKGVFTPREALARMLTGTKLISTPGRTRGAVAVTRAPGPNG